MSENKIDSGAEAPVNFADVWEPIDKFLDCTVEELIKKADKENWQVKELEFWLRVKEIQYLEKIGSGMQALQYHIEEVMEGGQ